ncbi:helix-turn-helix domain-containing protein [Chryseobacterium sp. G0162]|uniref:helix-turn-helix domain-containing protein n=1 Tax=Chryseobacterium sp. G0162 TaxID=2487063 RepID=UPI003977A4F7
MQDRVLLETKRLLLSTELNLKQICVELGFVETAHFCQFVKLKLGMTPTQFREHAAVI